MRKATLPKAPEEYELTLPAEFKPPEGVKFEFNKDDPTLATARAVAMELGLSKEGFSKLLGVYAANRINEATVINNARNAEIAKLGSAGPNRVDAVKTWMHATLGPDLGGALEQMLVTAKHVQAFEGLINRMSGQGGTSYSGNRQVPPAEQGKIPGYDKMSFEQRRLAQMQQKGAASGGGR